VRAGAVPLCPEPTKYQYPPTFSFEVPIAAEITVLRTFLLDISLNANVVAMGFLVWRVLVFQGGDRRGSVIHS
jgi:hypothetical protein